MIQAMYNGVSGLSAFRTEMDVISNNIANVNTVGFKSSRVNFRDAFSQTYRGASAGQTSGTGGVDPEQIGMGVSLGSIEVNHIQGSLQPTGKATDCAIEGDGFFMLSDGSGKYYSRDGSFTMDAGGNLVSTGSGLKVLGWNADTNGTVRTAGTISASSTIRIPMGQLSIAKQTSAISYGGNLDAATAAGQSYTVGSQVYDSLGKPHTMSLTFTRMAGLTSQGYADTDTSTVGTGSIDIRVGSGPVTTITMNDAPTPPATTPVQNNTLQGLADAINAADVGATASIVNVGTVASPSYTLQLTSSAGAVSFDTSGLTAGTGTIPTLSNLPDQKWAWSASSPDGDPDSPMGSGTVSFDVSGKCMSPPLGVTLTLASPNGAAAAIGMAVSMPTATMSYGESTLSTMTQDGFQAGTLNGMTVGKDGVISGSFTNGMSRALGQVAVAVFTNSSGLSRGGNNIFSETMNSGAAQVGQASGGGMGKITSGYLEASNVDLSQEFTNMIVAQRAFQANSRVITTSDEILQELVQLKR